MARLPEWYPRSRSLRSAPLTSTLLIGDDDTYQQNTAAEDDREQNRANTKVKTKGMDGLSGAYRAYVGYLKGATKFRIESLSGGRAERISIVRLNRLPD
jgi:hypothetical protein